MRQPKYIRPIAARTTGQPVAFDAERLLQISATTLVCLGGLLLGVSQPSTTLSLALAIVAAACASFYVTDVRGWIRLNRVVANALALLASVAFLHFFSLSIDEKLLTIARLLGYLQGVLMFQRKTPRIYGQILVLSVLEVAVGTAIGVSLIFGLLLMLYLFLGLATLALLFIYHETRRWQADADAAEAAFASPGNGGRIGRASRSRRPLFAARPAVETPPDSPAPPPPAIRLAPLPPRDAARELLGRGVLARTLGNGAGTLVVAAVCFFFMPRVGRFGEDSSRHTVGYSPTVKLGDLGPLLQDPALVMRVSYRSMDNGRPVRPIDPHWRGSVVTRYWRGEWRPPPLFRRVTARSQLWSLLPPPDKPGLLHQNITLEPMSEPAVFSIFPVYEWTGGHASHNVQFDLDRQQLVRNDDAQHDRFDYDLVTDGWRDRQQAELVPWSAVYVDEMEYQWNEREKRDLLGMPDAPSKIHGRVVPADARDSLAGLRAFAAERIHAAHLDDEPVAVNAYARAKELERALGSAPFEYSLTRDPLPPGVDPIEDFVTHNHRGHCEYFASALALMLRSQGIPARVAIGFHGGEWHSLESCFVVRQYHAHAWVEAYLKPEQLEQVPAVDRPADLPDGIGAWLELDPTPPTHTADEVGGAPLFSSVAQAADYAESLWSIYIVGLNAERQRRLVYSPLSALTDWAKQLWLEPKQSIADMLVAWDHEKGAPVGGWFGWRVGLSVVLLLAALYVAYRLGRGIWRLARRRWGGPAGAAIARPAAVEFYSRFEELLARYGLRRGASQTQLEFARLAGERLAKQRVAGGGGSIAIPPEAARSIADATGQIAAAFYSVRFGGGQLSAEAAAALHRSLVEALAATAAP